MGYTIPQHLDLCDIEYPVINGRKHPEIIHSFFARPSATTPLRIDAWENIQRDPNDIRYGYIWHVICENFQISCHFLGFHEKNYAEQSKS